MKNLRKRFEIFCYKHSNWGIPNLMLYIAIGSAIVSLLSLFHGGSFVMSLLYFDKQLILQGQVWRLFTYVFTNYTGGIFSIIFIYFFYMFGRHLEQAMGTFRFNLYYFAGVIFMGVFALLVFPTQTTQAHLGLYLQMGTFMHLSMVLTFAAMNPDSQFYIFFVIPIKSWILSIVYLVVIASQVYNYAPIFPCNLFPLVGIANFLLFAGKDALNLLPPAWRPKGRNQYRTVRSKPQKKTGTIPFPQEKAAPKQTPAYTHRCTICGRTDVSNPELEFRYCSRCNGYHCYCEDHISNHTHIE